MRLTTIACALAAALLGACATPDPDDAFADPYENFNRRMHAVNVTLDENVIGPAARGYEAATPALVQELVRNGLSHLELPAFMVNHLLQGEFDLALVTFGRFAVNTFAGAGGLLDPATEFGLPRAPNDFGLTIAAAGGEEGAFLVLPLIGPTTTRDLTGDIVDIAFDPMFYAAAFGGATAAPPARTVTRGLERRNANADLIDQVFYDSPDSYVTQRTLYLQRRRARVLGETDEEALPDIFDEEAPEG